MPLPTHLLYLHGFRSSPQSFKAQRLASWVKDHAPHMHWWCPQLPPSPREAMAMVQQGTADWPTARMAVIGSSLGGYYATALAESRGCKAMLLNPAIDPAPRADLPGAARLHGRASCAARARHHPARALQRHHRQRR
jgi:hypothetical protein